MVACHRVCAWQLHGMAGVGQSKGMFSPKLGMRRLPVPKTALGWTEVTVLHVHCDVFPALHWVHMSKVEQQTAQQLGSNVQTKHAAHLSRSVSGWRCLAPTWAALLFLRRGLPALFQAAARVAQPGLPALSPVDAA